MHFVRTTLILSQVVTSFSMALADKPNLIVIMADDLGYADVGFNGCRDIPTPHIDSIAENGVKFTSGYVLYAVCGPSRAGFITGRYEQRFGFERNPQYRPDDPNMGLPTDETTIAGSLSKVGYRCGVVGKWHLGANEVHHPLKRGFHQFFGHLGGDHRYMPEELTIKDSAAATDEAESYRTWILSDHTPVKTTRYLTDEFSNAAVSFVSSNKDYPFFLFLSYNAPHTPLQATTKYIDRFPNITDKKRKTYAAMVSAVDDGVGRVLSKLRELKLEDNTLVFFLSDNGGPTTRNGSRNTPLKGDKGDAWEGGYRVPFAARWPRGLPKGQAYNQPVSSLDIFATIAALSGAPTDPQRPLDGVNLIPYVTGKKNGPPHEAIYLRMFDSQKFAIRSGDHKLVIPARNVKPQLYDVTADVSESTNLATENPEILDELKQKLDAWTGELVEPRFSGLIHTPAFQKKQKNANRN
ncbi:MAG TPA: N-acetylgalactosamine 6-sulfate sulfatase [Planctomycetes bacterium]|nr:N-acetylgalactosamine 6-sulfate sulfatase [Planctomycetota bacterium]